MSALVHAGIHPPGQTPPVQCMLGYTPPAQCILGYTPPAQCILGSTPPPCLVHAGIHMATAADGTHPTGMHSCHIMKIYSSGGSRISPRWGDQPSGVPTYDFAKFSQKLCEIERIWICRGHASLAPPLDPPLYSKFTYWLYS